MDNFRMLSKRLDWTRSWLSDFKQDLPKSDDDFEIISKVDTASDDRRVKSIRDVSPSNSDSFLLIETSPKEVEQNHGKPILDDGESYVLMQRAYSDYTHIKEMDRRNASILSWDPWATDSFTTEEWQRFDFDHMFEDQYEIHVGNITKKTAIEYNIAGRAVENAFHDLRSTRRARRRLWAEDVKYDGYRDIKRGARAHPPTTTRVAGDEIAGADESDEEQRSYCYYCQQASDDAGMTPRLDKHAFYRAAQNAVRRRRGGYVHPQYKKTENDVPRYARFRQRKAKKERLAWNAEKDLEEAQVVLTEGLG